MPEKEYKYDFDLIRREVPIARVLERRGITVEKSRSILKKALEQLPETIGDY